MEVYSSSTDIPWYNTGEYIEKVIITEGVTNIGDYAFYGCSSLVSIEISSSVTSIGYGTFNDCSRLESVEIPKSVRSIGDFAFEGCSSLTSIEILGGVESIGYGIFYGCSSLERIEIPSSVTSIDSDAFYGCSSLTSIEIPEGVRSIGSNAFCGCDRLSKIEVDELNENYSSKDGVLFNKDKTVLVCYPSAKEDESYKMPRTVERIEDFAFVNCSKLKNVYISENIKEIPDSAFINIDYSRLMRDFFYDASILEEMLIKIMNIMNYESSSITNINVDEGNQYFSSEDGVLFNKDKTELICYPSGKSIDVYEVPSTVENINIMAFSGNKNLEEIYINDNIQSIETGAFMSCSNLRNIQIPNKDIGESGFLYANLILETEGMQEIELPEIIKRTQNPEDVLYSEDGYTFINCSFNEDGTKLIIDTEKAKTEKIGLMVESGILRGLVLVVEPTLTFETETEVKKITPSTTIKDFLSNIETNAEVIEIYKGETKITDENAIVGTGMTLKLSLNNDQQEYTLVVTGDLDGNGQMDDIDLLRMVRYKAKLDTTLQGVYLQAADIVKDNKPAEDNDLLKMARILAKLDKF